MVAKKRCLSDVHLELQANGRKSFDREDSNGSGFRDGRRGGWSEELILRLTARDLISSESMPFSDKGTGVSSGATCIFNPPLLMNCCGSDEKGHTR
jgi:hypothetical protein